MGKILGLLNALTLVFAFSLEALGQLPPPPPPPIPKKKMNPQKSMIKVQPQKKEESKKRPPSRFVRKDRPKELAKQPKQAKPTPVKPTQVRSAKLKSQPQVNKNAKPQVMLLENVSKKKVQPQRKAKKVPHMVLRPDSSTSANQKVKSIGRRDKIPKYDPNKKPQKLQRQLIKRKKPEQAKTHMEVLREKRKAQREAKEKARKERLAKIKAEKEAKEKARKERLAQQKAEREAKAKARKERLAKAKTEKEAKEKARREALAKAKAEKEAKIKAQQEAQAKVKAEKELKAKADKQALTKQKEEQEAAELAAALSAKREGKPVPLAKPSTVPAPKIPEAKPNQIQKTKSDPKKQVQKPKPVPQKTVQKPTPQKRKVSSTPFNPPRIYTPEVVEDNRSAGKKGAVSLVWTRYRKAPMYEVELVRNGKANKFVHKRNSFHIMVYYNQAYQWRVRVLDENKQPLSEFSKLRDLKVVRDGDPEEYRNVSSDGASDEMGEDEMLLDEGGE